MTKSPVIKFIIGDILGKSVYSASQLLAQINHSLNEVFYYDYTTYLSSIKHTTRTIKSQMKATSLNG
ncbi:MAG: hypothetical protein HC912_01800 [Saprospiraceae bacterium]|nr:hypothetical protein [Saprospiraceae bacterium]